MKNILLLVGLFFAIFSNAQVSAYSFTQTTSSYAPITGGTVIATATANTAAGSLNDAIYNLASGNIPFTFIYNGSGYTGCNISTNGFITFGATAPASTLYSPLSSTATYSGAISAFGGDLNSVFSLGTASVTGQIRVETVGVAPDREFVIQWSNWRPASSTVTTNAYAMNFQIRLEETSNKVTVAYGAGSYLMGSTGITGTRQVGLRGTSNSDFNNRVNSASSLFIASTQGPLNSSAQTFSTTGSVPAMPSNGLTYIWQALTPCSGTPSAGDATTSNTLLCSPTTVTLGLVNSTTGANNLTYQWQSSPNGTVWTSIPTATTQIVIRPVSATTYFQCIVACGSNSAASTPILVTYGAPVTGGSSTSSSTLLCTSGQSVALNLSGSSAFPEVNYQWQSSPNGSTWTSIGSATLSTLNPIVNATTYYQSIISCGSYTAAASSVLVTISSIITNTVPYSESFEDIIMNDQLPNCSWKASDLLTTCKTYTAATGSYNQYAKTGSKFASFNYNTNPTGDYFYSNGLQLTAGVNYIASADYITDGATGWSEFKLLYGASQSTTGLTPIFAVTGAITNTLYANAAGTFSVASTGIYYIAVKAIGNANPWFLTFDDLKVFVAPPCTLTPVAGAISGPTNVLSGSSNSFTLSPATGNIQWYQSSSTSGPWTVIGGANSSNQSITSLGSGNIYYTAVASTPGCVNDTTNVPLQVTINFPGDNVCNAIPLSIGTSGYYKPYGATTQSGEVAPPGTGCSTNKSWCNAVLNNTMWFSFIAPASGYVSVQAPSSLNGGNNDSQLAIWSGTTCGSLLSSTTATLLAANDDDAAYTSHSGAQFSSYVRAACLTPGTTYYIQFDTSSDATPDDSTRIIITNLGTLNTSFTGLAANYCIPASSSVLTPATTGGVFTLNTNTTTITSFNPTTAGVGTHTISYSIYGCKSMSTTIVNNAPTITVASSTTAICIGSAVTLTANGATNYTWSPGTINTAIANVSPTITTNYSVAGSNGICSATKTISINVSSSPTITASSSATTICSGSSVTLTASGATTYTWMPGSLTTSLAIVSPTTNTTYTVLGKTGICSSTKTVNINVNTALTVLASATSTNICTGSSATLTGSGAATYTWNPGAITGSTITVTPTTSTIYTLTGSNGSCSGTSTLGITVSGALSVSASTSGSAICAGSSATLTANGAASYTWNPGNIISSTTVVSPTVSTTYTLDGSTGTCSGTTTLAISVSSNPTVNATSSSTSVCAGGSATLTALGATSYTWLPGNITTATAIVSPTATTIYTLTGSNGLCLNTKTISLTVLTNPTVNAAGSSTSICSGSSVTLTASGATNYTWMPGSVTTTVTVRTPTISTTYTLTGNNGSCSATKTISINVTATPTVTATRSASLICSGTTVTLTATGAAGYTWTPGTLTNSLVIVSPSANTTYTVVGKNGSCSNTKTISVNVTASPTITASSSSSAVCSGASSTLTAGGATSYTWMPGSISNSVTVVTPTINTTYTLSGTNGTCSNTKTISINVTTTPTVNVVSSSSLVCSGSSATLTASGAATFSWLPSVSTSSNEIVTPSSNTIYTITGYNGICSNTKTIAVNVAPNPMLTITASNTLICEGAIITMTASGATNYTWVPVNNFTSIVSDAPTSDITYTVNGDDGICSNTTTLSVSVTPNPVISISASSASVCAGSTVTLTASGATNYTWIPTGGTTNIELVTPMINTTYTVNGEANGCESTNTLEILITSNPTVTASSNTAICVGSSATLTANGASTYSWMPTGGTSNTETVNPIASTIYTVTGSNGNCSSSSTVSVDVNSLPTLSAMASQTLLCDDGSTGNSILTAISSATNYAWFDGATTMTTSVTPTLTTVYSVTVTSDEGCSSEASVTVNVSNCTGIKAMFSEDILLFPNPNNGFITVSVSDNLAGNSFIEIYDALGKLVMNESLTNKTSCIKTATLPDGVYLYKITKNKQTIKAGRMVKN